MCKKLFYLVPVTLVLTLLLANTASADLIAHWPLDGDYADATGNGHDGTPLDDPKFVVDAEKGLVMEVDGNARVMVEDTPDLNFTANQSLTMTVWILYDPSLASSGWRSPCGKGRTNVGGDTSYLDTMYGFFVSPGNEWASNMGSLGGGVGPAVADEWHHFAFVQDGQNNENFYYINLEVVQSGGAADCSTPGRPFFIGASGSDTSPFEGFGGRISDVRIYNEALSGDTLAATTVPLSGKTEILLTFSDLDQAGEVPVAADYQPSELDGTGITTTWTDMQQFNDDIAGEGLRDHTVTWDQTAASVYVYTENEGSVAFNTEVEVSSIWILQDSWASTTVTGYLAGQEMWSVPADHPEQWIEITAGAGQKIDSIVFAGGYSRIDDITIKVSDTYSATNPSPADDADDVRRDVVLGWKSGTVTNPQDALLIEGHNSNNYDPDIILDLGQTYFWRIDEVNAAPDYTVHRGKIWSFTAEPVGYPIVDVTATASSSTPGQGPENTINGSGLDVNGLHSMESNSMWLSEAGGAQPTWIEYEFDKPYKLHEMWVWNFNIEFENVVGFGLSDVTIEYSTDGNNWQQLTGVPQFARGSGTDDYAHNTTIDFAGALAKSVRITANSNHGPFDQYGLSEVRFFYISGWAREPDPQHEATGIHPDVVLNWRPGREAVTHDVYLSTDEQEVIDGTATAVTVTETSYDAGTLELGKTYNWRVDEVNDAESPAIWQGDIWNFTTAEYLVVDNFESYNDLDPSDPESNRIFMKWKDGFGYGAQDNPPYYPGNGTGSVIGHAAPPFVENQIVHGGSQSMPYFYDNSGSAGKANYSEAEVDISELAIGSDWTKAGVNTLTVYFYGDPANSANEQMYVKINGVEVSYDGDSGNLTHGIWQQWDIDLSSLVGVDLQNVTEIIIGFRDGGGSGVVYFDDIRLNPAAQLPEHKAPDDTALVAQWDFEGDFSDATGKGHDGLAYGDPAIVDDPLRGQVLEVDGDDRIGISDAPELNFGANESMTLTAWVNFDIVDAPEGWKGIVAKGRTEMGGGTGYVPELYGFYISPSNNWHINSGGINGDAHMAPSGQWHHLAFVQDGPANEGYFYINGEVVMSGGADSCDTTGRPLFIGAAGTDVSVFESFKGRIDDVRIYSYALSEPEIQYLVADLQAPDDTALVAHWDFEGDFTDATGNGHDGLAFGDPAIVNDPLRGQVLVVDGDDRIGVSDAPDLNFGPNESMTLTTWANFEIADAPEGWRGIVAKGRTELGGGTNYVPELYGFYISPSNNWHVNSGGVNGDSHAAPSGQWHHLAFVQDGPANEGYFYIDGEVVMSGGADSCDTTGRPLFIGAAGTDVDVSVFEAFKGRIDDVRIYSYALSELEIQYLVISK
jgi:hypothetical protein